MQAQVLTIPVFFILTLIFSSKESKATVGAAVGVVASVVVFIFFFYGVTPLSSRWYRESLVLQSKFLVLH